MLIKKISKQVKPDVKFKATQSTSSQLKTPQNPKGKTGYYRKVMKSVKNKFGVELKYNDTGDLYFKKKGKEITHADMKEVQKYIIELVPKNLI